MKELSYNEITKITANVDEQEFTLTAMRSDDTVSCFCSDNMMLTRLKEVMKQNPDEYKCYVKSYYPDGSIAGYEFVFPKKYLKFAVRDRVYNMTDEQRAAAKERMKKAREAKANK